MLWPVRTTASTSIRPFERLGVPTQMSERSDSATAWSLDVVARSRPAPTTSRRSSGNPGSTIGEVAELIIATFSALTSTPTTAWPALARHAAVTHPTYPRPNTLTRMATRLLALVFEFVDDPRPGVPLLDEAAAGAPDRATPGRIPQERRHGPGERGGIVGLQKIPTRRQRESLGADRRRDHCLGHRKRLEDLEPGPAADPERHNVDGRLGHVRPDVVDETGDVNPGRVRGGPQARRRVAADHGQGGARHLATNPRQHGLDEVDDAVLEAPRELSAERRHPRLVEIDRQGREPRPDKRQREARASALGQRPRHRDDLALRQRRLERARILRWRVSRQERDVVAPRQLAEHVKAPDPPAGVDGPEAADLHPDQAHDVSGPWSTSPTSSPSRNMRCQSSRLMRSHRRSPCSAAPLRCASASRRSAAGSKSPRSSARGPSTSSSTSGRKGPRSHRPTGTGKPILRRVRISRGTTSWIAARNTAFVCQPRSFVRPGIAATRPTNSWSRNGTRLSIEAAMLIWSCFIKSSTRYVWRSA